MEFTYKLWTLLSSPNILLTNTIALPLLLLFENFISITLILTISNEKKSKFQKILYIITTSTICTIITNLFPIPFNILFNIVIVAILLYKLLNLDLAKSFFFSIFIPIVFCVLGSLISNPYTSILGITVKEIVEIPICRILYNIIIDICFLGIIFILKICKIDINTLNNLTKKSKLILLLSFIFIFFTINIQCHLTTYYADFSHTYISFWSFIALLSYFYLSIFALAILAKLCMFKQKLQSTESYNNALRILHDNIKSFKHDFDNILITFGGYIMTDDMKGLKQYYAQLKDDYDMSNNLYVLTPEVVNNYGIYNLLIQKYEKAISKNIKMHITFLLDLSTLKMKIYEFSRILGILLDNAIEASSECDEKIINLIFRNDIKTSRQLIIIENTYKNKNVDTEKIFEKGFSGKENHSGIGLWQIRRIIKKYNNVNLFTSKTDELFIQQLEIYY